MEKAALLHGSVAPAAHKPDRAASLAAPVSPPARGDDGARRLRLAESVGRMGHWHADLAGGALTGSPQAFSILGVDPGGALPDMQVLLNLVHPEDRAEIEQTIQEAVAGPAPFEVDGRISRPDGSWRSIICTGQPETDARGRATALFGVISDVTEAFDAIRSIQDQNEMLGMAGDLAHLGHWVWNCDQDRLTFCSDELGRIHELAPGTVIRQFTHPALFAVVVVTDDRDRYRATVTETLARSQTYKIEYRIKTRSGAFKDIRETGQPILSREGTLVRYIATAQDVTEAKRRENELREARRQVEEQAEALRRSEQELERKTAELQRLNVHKAKLFSIIAHDLRIPFNSIIGFSDLLVAKAKDFSRGQTLSYAQIVRDSAVGVHELLDNLLAWAAIQIRDGGLNSPRSI